MTSQEKKELALYLVSNWNNLGSYKAIADKFGVKLHKVSGIVSQMRKRGIDLPKKNMGSDFWTPELIAELKANK